MPLNRWNFNSYLKLWHFYSWSQLKGKCKGKSSITLNWKKWTNILKCYLTLYQRCTVYCFTPIHLAALLCEISSAQHHMSITRVDESRGELWKNDPCRTPIFLPLWSGHLQIKYFRSFCNLFIFFFLSKPLNSPPCKTSPVWLCSTNLNQGHFSWTTWQCTIWSILSQ